MRIHLRTLGCRLNEAELETWSRQFSDRGYRLTNNADEADLVVVNTCAVTQEAVRKSRRLVRRVHRHNPQAKLVISGCHATLNPEESLQTHGVDLVVENRDKDRLVELAAEALELRVMPELATEPGESPILARGRQRAFVKVQDGCRYRCAFCIVTVARGEERSRPVDEVIEEVNRLHAEGIQEIVLTGVHIGGYGSDSGTDLYALIEAVLARTSIPRLRLGSVEPWDLPEDFWDLFANPRFMPHLHLPLQSGSDRVLRRMARRCHTADFRQLVKTARHRVPDINITTDVIVGFPGEQESDWQQTLRFVEQLGFGHLHIFAYSPRAGTKAASLPDQIPGDIKRTRSEALHALDKDLKRATLERFVGRVFPVLIESRRSIETLSELHWVGYTPNFLPVLIDAPEGAIGENQILAIYLQGVDESGEYLLGSLAN